MQYQWTLLDGVNDSTEEMDGIVRLLKVRDPLSERVHLSKPELLAQSIGGMVSEMIRRAAGRRPLTKPAAGA